MNSGTSISLAKTAVKTGLEAVSGLRPKHWPAIRMSWAAHRGCTQPTELNIKAAISWLKRAQDVTGTDGVSWGYRARVPIGCRFPVGWQLPYPETSGYIIETLIRYGDHYSDPDAVARARRIASWEVGIQLPDGGIQGGPLGVAPVSSSTFVTGQVLFGFVRAHQKFGDQLYLDAAQRAAKFLLSCLNESGQFVRGYSHFCAPGPKVYEVRTAWALALYGHTYNDPEAVEAAERMSEFALRCQNPNGWFQLNDLDEHEQPLTHTIGYTLEGLLENGILLGERRYIDAVGRTLTRLRELTAEDGFLAGRWRSDWKAAVDSCCLTGNCQIARVCYRAHKYFPKDGLVELGDRLVGFVTGTQVLTNGLDGFGAIHGSYPFGGDYGPFCSPNWAAKFYIDAMLERTNG